MNIKSVRPGVIDRVGVAVAVAALWAVVIRSQRVTGNDNNAARCRRRPLCSPCESVLLKVLLAKVPAYTHILTHNYSVRLRMLAAHMQNTMKFFEAHRFR